MVGPGTGIAPFRAFLQQREAVSAPGKNWLFFGEQHESTDFLFKEELKQHEADGLLTKLTTAFSRDQQERIYVQHCMFHEAAELWA
jgi:sulfite reductase (NADPH) flavoprotein alpha-component